MGFDNPVARQQIVEVAVDEAVLPDQLKHQVQEQPGIFDRNAALDRERKQDVHFTLEVAENGVEDFILVAKMVIQVAGRNVHFVTDHAGGDIGLAEVIEQAVRQFNDPLAGAPFWFALHGSLFFLLWENTIPLRKCHKSHSAPP